MSSNNTVADSLARPRRPAPTGGPPQTLAGCVGIASGLLFLAMLVWEYSYGEYSSGPEDGADVMTHTAGNEVGFTIALVGYVVLALGLLRSGATGRGRRGRVAVIGFAAGFAILAFANLLTLLGVGDNDSDPLLPAGGLLQTLGGLAVGLIVARVGAWRGLQRWWPLVLAVYWLVAMFVPLFAGVESDFPREALWALSYVLLGLAVLTDGGRRPLWSTTATGR